MPNSFSQKAQLTCPQTNKPFEFEVWLIVDRDERPDLIERIRAGSLHTIISPYTGDELGDLDAPLLIFQPNHTPPLLFSPAQETTEEEDQQQVIELLEQLEQNLGTNWRDEWLEDGLSAMVRTLLGEAIDNFQQAEQMLQQVQNQRNGDDPTDEIRAIVQELSQPARDARDILRNVELCRRALSLLPKQSNKQAWAALQVVMGNSLAQNQLGDKADNIEEAIRAYESALTVFTRETMSEDWADAKMGLGNAYAERVNGDKANNIEEAVRAYKAALTVFTRVTMPVEWAQTTTNLGNTYAKRIKGNKSDNIEEAIRAYQAALTVLTREKMPVEWATTTMNLGNAYRYRIKGDKADNIEQAIRFYESALDVSIQETMPMEWAQTMMNLGLACRERIKGNKSDNIKKSIGAYEAALTIFTREAFPINHRDTLRNLVNLYFGERRWAEAHQTCLNAIAVGKDIFAAGIGDAGRMDALKQTGDLYTQGAYSAVQLGRYGEALALLEAGKARLLSEALSLGDDNLAQLNDEERERVQAYREQIKGLEYEYRLPTDHPARRTEQTLIAELGEVRASLRGLIDEFHAKYPDFMPEGLALDELLANIPADGALVAPLFTEQGSAIFIVPGGAHEVTAEHVLLLDDFKLDDLTAITRSKDGNPGWLRYYIDYRFNGAGMKSLFDSIENVMHRLWEVFIGRVHERLQALGVQHVLFMPQGDTNLLPLHATWREVDGVRRSFMDDYLITYTPSMSTLATAKRKSVVGDGALVAGVSHYTEMNDLPNARAEAESIAAVFGTSALLDGAASVDAVREGVRGKAYVHLSSHGGFGWGGDAYASALYLGNDEALPLPQIMATLELSAARLVVLSACETGIVDFRSVPDEFVGLPAGFLQAGAQAVVSSLWTVDDRSTALLMERLYKNMFDKGMEAAEALREAQFWLRDVTAQEIGDYYQSYLVPRMSQSEASAAFIEILRRFKPDEKPYEHPYFWAAFVYSGV